MFTHAAAALSKCEYHINLNKCRLSLTILYSRILLCAVGVFVGDAVSHRYENQGRHDINI